MVNLTCGFHQSPAGSLWLPAAIVIFDSSRIGGVTKDFRKYFPDISFVCSCRTAASFYCLLFSAGHQQVANYNTPAQPRPPNASTIG
jgi:hypothetical protein